MAKSVEPQVKDWFAGEMKKHKTKYNIEQNSINREIEKALKNATSKSGGSGGNRPDFQMMISTSFGNIPVMIEAKGIKGKLAKLNADGTIANIKKDGTPNWTNISGFAVNGALHYAEAVTNYTSYGNVIVAGVNGYTDESGELRTEIQLWAVLEKNAHVPKLIGNDIAALYAENVSELEKKIESASLSEKERKIIENRNGQAFEDNLKELNQLMHESTNISVSKRIQVVAGLIMAGTPADGIEPLALDDLKGINSRLRNDGKTVMACIGAFLDVHNLPDDKKDLVLSDMKDIFEDEFMWRTNGNGESKIKYLFSFVQDKIIPYTNMSKSGRIDYTGRLFNVMTDWIARPDAMNDQVLTPEYVTNLSAKICRVNMKSHVKDLTAGSGGFLVAAMKIMLSEAEKIEDPAERAKERQKIFEERLMGADISKRMIMLSILNLTLLGDGATSLYYGDSMQFDETYQNGNKKGEPFVADVFMMNTPYSAPNKGLNFVEKGIQTMKDGWCSILIQENAGTIGNEINKNILKKCSLKASIHMADVFKGKASVQTSIYLFRVGIPHDERDNVIFIDMTNDGYQRQNRKRASAATNLKNLDHADERYEEVADLVLGRKPKTNFYKEGKEVFYDTISLNGDDWTMAQHRVIDSRPTKEDFMKTVNDYLVWKISEILNEEENEDQGES